MSKNKIYEFKGLRYKVPAFSILAAILVISYLEPIIPDELMFGSYSYSALGLLTTGFLGRLTLYSLSILMVFSLLVLIPRKQFSFTHLGQYTLYVYLLHGVFIQLIRKENLLQLNQNLDIIPLAIIAATMVWFLSTKWVITLTQPLIEGRAFLIKEELNKFPYRKEEFK